MRQDPSVMSLVLFIATPLLVSRTKLKGGMYSAGTLPFKTKKGQAGIGNKFVFFSKTVEEIVKLSATPQSAPERQPAPWLQDAESHSGSIPVTPFEYRCC